MQDYRVYVHIKNRRRLRSVPEQEIGARLKRLQAHLAGKTVWAPWLSREPPPVGLSLLI